MTKALPVPKRIDFAIVGFQKAGTTGLAHLLRHQPGVDLAYGEQSWFEREEIAPSDTVSTGLVGFKRADLIAADGGIDRLVRHSPDVRLLLSTRPRGERAVSAYLHYVRDGFAPLRPLDHAFEELLADGEIAGYPRTAEILSYGMYGAQTSGLLEALPREQLLIVSQAQVAEQRADFLSSVGEFLGIGCSPVKRRVAMPTHRRRRRLQARRALNPLMYRYADGGMRLEGRSRYVNTVISRIDDRLGTGDPESDFVATPELLSLLDAYYREDAELFETLEAYAWQ